MRKMSNLINQSNKRMLSNKLYLNIGINLKMFALINNQTNFPIFHLTHFMEILLHPQSNVPGNLDQVTMGGWRVNELHKIEQPTYGSCFYCTTFFFCILFTEKCLLC